ncbi:DUF6350 family protein [Aldersonia kunmingensis]|uniref:cell division protein PerM n=1 Tax=Aldersonia kunmingensis TaxID=408066 RepID=UPI00082ABCC8|nr:DUF6350 family protein [Aldersonia kunmingensis]
MSAVLDSDARDTRDADRRRPVLTPERSKTLVVVAFRPAIVALTLTATLVVVALVAASSDLTGAFGGIAGSWFAIHQVPLTISGRTLGLLPLLPTIGIIWFVARTCERAVADSRDFRDVAAIAAAAVAGPVVFTLVCLAVVADAAGVITLEAPNALAAIGWVALIHLLGASAGLVHACWRDVVVAARLPDWAVASVFAAVAAARRLLIAAAVLTVVSLVVHGSTAIGAFDVVDGFSGTLGLLVVAIAYLPNAVIAAAAVLVGAPVQIGAGSAGLIDVTGAEMPDFPLLAALPTGPAQQWWLFLLVIPAVLGGLLGRDCAKSCEHRVSAAQAALTAGALIAAGAVLAGAMAGGILGGFGMYGPQVLWFGLCTFGWFGVVGAVAALVIGARPLVEESIDDVDESEIGGIASDDVPTSVAAPAAVEAELIGEPVADEPDVEGAEIVDAEVVEPDLEQGSPKADR